MCAILFCGLEEPGRPVDYFIVFDFAEGVIVDSEKGPVVCLSAGHKSGLNGPTNQRTIFATVAFDFRTSSRPPLTLRMRCKPSMWMLIEKQRPWSC